MKKQDKGKKCRNEKCNRKLNPVDVWSGLCNVCRNAYYLGRSEKAEEIKNRLGDWIR